MASIAILDPRGPAGPTRFIGAAHLPGHRVEIIPTLPRAEMLALLAGVEILIVGQTVIDAPIFDAAPDLRLIVRTGSGTDSIDVDTARARDVKVCSTPDARAAAVAEHALFGLLHIAQCGWDPARQSSTPLDLDGATLGLVGLGRIGTRIARACHALGMEVSAATRSGRTADDVRSVDLERIHRECDVLVLAAPLDDRTRGLIDANALARMRPRAILVNVARGPLVVTEDLVRAMSDGQLLGAALDVTDPEPLPDDHPLRSLPNVLVTPHVAGTTPLSLALTRDAVIAAIADHVAGRTPLNLVGRV